MFENIDSKIKALAQFLCWCGIGVSVLAGIIMCFMEELILVGILTLVIGSLASWAGAFLLYGFGELIEYQKIQTELALKVDAERHNQEVAS